MGGVKELEREVYGKVRVLGERLVKGKGDQEQWMCLR